MPSSSAFTIKTTSTAVGINAHPTDLRFKKAPTNAPIPTGRGTDILAAGDAGNEFTPSIVKDGNGNLWIFYVLDDGADPNIYIRESTDNGQTWSTAWYVQVDGVQTTPVATIAPDGRLYAAAIDLGTDTQMFLMGIDTTTDPTTWTWWTMTPVAQQVNNHDMGAIACYDYSGFTVCAMTYIADIVYPPYSVPQAAVVTHNGTMDGQWTFTWDSTWNGRPATHSSIAASNNLFFFAFQYTNTTVGKEIINVRWGDAVAQNDMEQWKNQWGTWETPYTANCVEPAVGASGTNAIVVYQSDAAGNQDIMCSYSTDNGATWTHNVAVANTASDETHPRVFMAGNNAYCLFMKEGNLFLTTSTDAGATWGAPIQINDQAGTVVSAWHDSDVYGSNIVWTDSRGADQDLYFDTGGILLPHLTVSLVSGGIGVTAKVTNDGEANATNLVCNIAITGGMLHKVNVSKTATQAALLVGGDFSFKSGFFLGLGAISITVSATCDEGASASQTYTAKILLFYVKV